MSAVRVAGGRRDARKASSKPSPSVRPLADTSRRASASESEKGGVEDPRRAIGPFRPTIRPLQSVPRLLIYGLHDYQ